MAKAVAEEEFLAIGMEYIDSRWEFKKASKIKETFARHFGASPLTCHEMWAHLITLGEIPKAAKPKYFLLALKFLFKSDGEEDLMCFFGVGSDNTVRQWCNFFVERFAMLLEDKMLSFEDADDGPVFFMTVDGTHCPIYEPRPFDKKWSSHKLGGSAGVDYEVGLSINKDKLIWLYGPVPAGEDNDLAIARRELLPAIRAYNEDNSVDPPRRILADGIYLAEEDADIISSRNEFDPREVEDFKDRALSRHENFNNLLKKWKVLDTKFRQKHNKGILEEFLDYHRSCFHAVCAIVCYQLDNGSYKPLLDPYP